jgi:hypothetical protein
MPLRSTIKEGMVNMRSNIGMVVDDKSFKLMGGMYRFP